VVGPEARRLARQPQPPREKWLAAKCRGLGWAGIKNVKSGKAEAEMIKTARSLPLEIVLHEHNEGSATEFRSGESKPRTFVRYGEGVEGRCRNWIVQR